MENSQFLLNGGVLRLPPGFRFHPTDEELVVHYLRRKAYGCPLPVAIIPDIDLGKYDPWDLPGADEQDRYFFDLGDAKRRRGGRRRNRTANSGYWKPTGRDKKITASAKGGEVVGMKTVLAFHRGMLPHGVKTDWIMHEYRLVSAPSSMAPSRDLVLCRIFLKRGPTKMSIDGIEHHASARIGNASVGLVDLFRRQPSSSSESSCVTDLSEENTNEEEEGEEEENSSNSIDSSSCKRQV